MSCGCAKVERTDLWTPIPPYRQPTEIQPGENIDCYMKRAGNTYNQMDNQGPMLPDTIANTSIVSTIDRSTPQKETKVNETFTLTPESTRTPTSWSIKVDGVSGVGALGPELTFDTATGRLSGEILNNAKKAKNHKVLITALDNDGEIDSREFNLYIRDEKEDEVKFLMPLVGPGARITSRFGPRRPPASGASSVHKGIDMSCAGDARGDIVASADGIVVQAGPARGFGNWIIIDHFDKDNRKVAATLYAHMNQMFVKVGQRVSAGQVIAKEGTAGIGSGAHLHFEMHRGGYKNPVDPVPYFEGKVDIAVDNSGASAPSGSVPTSSVTNSGSGMVAAQSSVNNDCTPNPSNIDTAEESQDGPPAIPTNNVAPNTASCRPSVRPTSAEVLAEINRALNDAGVTDPEDRDFIITVATIESNLDPYAKNPTSSATGLYQFLDRLAVEYYGRLGYPVTCETRCDAYKATRAMALFYQREMLPYWNGFVGSGKTKIANRNIRPSQFSGQGPQFYTGLRKPEFIYGLIHHDGVGNAVNGTDKGGVAYWRRRRSGA